MKKFQKPLAPEFKHFTQRKWFHFNWNKMEELFIGKLNFPCFQFQIEYRIQSNCLLEQTIIETLTQEQKIHQNPAENKPTYISIQPQQWQRNIMAHSFQETGP